VRAIRLWPQLRAQLFQTVHVYQVSVEGFYEDRYEERPHLICAYSAADAVTQVRLDLAWLFDRGTAKVTKVAPTS
jgi:hypothetical protein